MLPAPVRNGVNLPSPFTARPVHAEDFHMQGIGKFQASGRTRRSGCVERLNRIGTRPLFATAAWRVTNAPLRSHPLRRRTTTILVAVLLFGSLTIPGLAETFDLRGIGRLNIYAFGDWKITGEDLGDKFEIRIEPKSDANAGAVVSIGLVPDHRFDTPGKMRERVIAVCERVAETSVEKKAVLHGFYRKQGFGYYCRFTDPDRVGKPPVRGDFKIISAGMVLLSPGIVATVNIMADDFDGQPYQELLGAIEGMEFEPRN